MAITNDSYADNENKYDLTHPSGWLMNGVKHLKVPSNRAITLVHNYQMSLASSCSLISCILVFPNVFFVINMSNSKLGFLCKSYV